MYEAATGIFKEWGFETKKPFMEGGTGYWIFSGAKQSAVRKKYIVLHVKRSQIHSLSLELFYKVDT